MDYYCDLCDIFIRPKSKYKHSKSTSHKEFDNCNHIKLTKASININDVYQPFYEYIMEQNTKFDYYLVKSEFKLVFNDLEYCP